MYKPYRENTLVDIKIPWDRNTARGFGLSVAINFIFILLCSTCNVDPPTPYEPEIRTIPLELINFGLGDGTGLSKGNLSREGAAHKGSNPSSDLEDASIASKGKTVKAETVDDPTAASKINPINDITSNDKNSGKEGSSSKNVGNTSGTPGGTGTGQFGNGPGAGEGFGDIQWGGGGNRVVLQKKLPKYPNGMNTNAQIKIKFTVSQDGTVISMVPLQRGDPTLERAAMDALRQWRFNRLKENKEMYGIITFTLRVS